VRDATRVIAASVPIGRSRVTVRRSARRGGSGRSGSWPDEAERRRDRRIDGRHNNHGRPRRLIDRFGERRFEREQIALRRELRFVFDTNDGRGGFPREIVGDARGAQRLIQLRDLRRHVPSIPEQHTRVPGRTPADFGGQFGGQTGPAGRVPRVFLNKNGRKLGTSLCSRSTGGAKVIRLRSAPLGVFVNVSAEPRRARFRHVE